jgi:serine/threonine protein kinase
MDPWLGRVIDGRYLLTKRIGQGASASVYRSESMAISRQFAIKIIHPPRGNQGPSPEQIATRLEREIEALGRLRNPHIVRFYDVIELPLNHIGVVMDFVEGETLESLVLRGDYLPVSRACTLLRQIANGVYEAHLAGMTHRDLKPENVMVEQLPAGDDFVHVLDFGIVQVEGEASMTQGFIGTPLYASPEQAMGEEIDHRSDIYSLGAMFFFMLAGRPPFLGQNVMQVLRQHVEVTPPSISDLRSDMGVPDELELLIGRMLAKTVDQRPESLAEVIHSLDRLSYSTSEGKDTADGVSEPVLREMLAKEPESKQRAKKERWQRPTHKSGETSPGVPFKEASSVVSEASEPHIAEDRLFQTEPTAPPPGPLSDRSSQGEESSEPNYRHRSGTPRSGIFGRVKRSTSTHPEPQEQDSAKVQAASFSSSPDSQSISVAAAQSIPEQVRVKLPDGIEPQIVAATSELEFAFTHDQKLYHWRLDDGAHKKIEVRGAAKITALALADGLALIGRDSGSIEQVKLDTGEVEALFESVFSDVVVDLRASRDGKLMFALMSSGRLYMSSVNKPANEWVRVRGGKPARSIALSPKGDLVAVAREGGTIEVSRVAEPKQIRLTIEADGDIRHIAFTDDGYLLGVSSGGDSVGLYQVLNGKKIVDVDVDGKQPLAFFFSKHNSLIGYVIEDREVFVIDLQA